MAKRIIDLSIFNDPTADLPDGSLKNRVYDRTVEPPVVLEEGSRIDADWIQDLLNPFHKMGRFVNKFLSGVADNQTESQYFSWLAANIMHRGSNFYEATSSDAILYSLSRAQYEDSPVQYKAGLIVEFVVPVTNSTSTVYLSAAGLATRRLTDHELAAGEFAELAAGTLPAGEFVRACYTVRASDSYGYFRLMKTSLSQLADGETIIDNSVSGTGDRLEFKIGELLMRTFTPTTYKYTRIYDAGIRTESVPTPGQLFFTIMDRLNGVLVAGLSTSLFGTMQTRMSGRGIVFDGGPNDADTDGVEMRATVINVPLGAVKFFVSPSAPNHWRMYTVGGTTYTLNTGIPAGAKILSAYAHYTTANGDQRAASVGFTDTGVSPDNNWTDVTIQSGEATVTSSKPVCDTSGQFVQITVWYDAASIA
jgi:hypothetical protein